MGNPIYKNDHMMDTYEIYFHAQQKKVHPSPAEGLLRVICILVLNFFPIILLQEPFKAAFMPKR
jgi:hypothetical protein